MLEKAMSGLKGLDRITSTSSEGSSRIILNFFQDTDLTRAANDVRDILGSVKNRLPDDAADPRMQRFDPSSFPIMNIALVGNLAAVDLRSIALDYVQAEFEQVDGVAQADVRGGRDKIVNIEINRSAMEAFGLTLTDISRSVRAQNADASGGSIQQGGRRYLIRSVGSFLSLKDIEDVIVGTPRSSLGDRSSAAGPRPVRLAEIATVRLEGAEETQTVLVNGMPGVYISVQKESGSNSVRVADAVRIKLNAIKKTLPEGLELRVLDDTTTSIKASLNQVISSLLIGGLLTLAVLFFFLRNIRATLAIAVSIPVSLLATLLAMSIGGLSLNTISLSGLILGIGMIVDSSIVILENIHRRRSLGMDIESAAIIGTDEMLGPIAGSALTTVCVFAPAFLFRRGLGSFSFIIGDIAFTVIFAVLASLVIAGTLVPVFASTFLPLQAEEDRFKHLHFLKGMDAFFERGFTNLENGYAKTLGFVLKHRLASVFIVIGLLSVAASYWSKIPFIYSPSSAEDAVNFSIQLREGAVLEETKDATLRIADLLRREVPDAKDFIVTIGGGSSSSNSSQISVRLPPVGTKRTSPEAVAAIARKAAENIPGLRLSVRGNRGRGLSGANPVEIIVRSRDWDSALSTAESLVSLARERFPEIVEPQMSVGASLSQLSVVLDRARAADLGVSAQAAAAEIRATTSGVSGGVYRSGGLEYDIQIGYPSSSRSSLADLDRIFVKNTAGERISLAGFANIERTESPVSIQREKGRRLIRVTASLKAGVEATQVQPRLEEAVKQEIAIPSGVIIEYAGELSAIKDTNTQLYLVLAVAIALVFAVMASLFESFISPFIIFLTIPTMIIGVVMIYAVLGQPFSMFSMLGLVMLAGIVVNNGIVLVDYTNLLRVRGKSLFEACIEAGRHRLRPILITTITTIFGMTPLAFFPGEGARITQPVGLTIIGGLAVSPLSPSSCRYSIHSLPQSHASEGMTQKPYIRKAALQNLYNRDPCKKIHGN
ncbi:efflux RND transporter permease subunit [Treponema sp.]